jgi:PhnB protein
MKLPMIQPYLNFSGRCDEALEFYQAVLGAEVEMLMRFKESPDDTPMELPAGWGEKVMHCSFRVGGSVLMASDGCGDAEAFAGFTLSITLEDESAARVVFDALANDGNVLMPMGPTFWSSCFGMVSDRFGLSWMVTVPPAAS